MIHVHCDGSIGPKNPGGDCGWGFAATCQATGEITEQCGGWPAAPGNTNNRAEMSALLHALLWLHGREAHIWSDSQYVVNGMNVWSAAWIRRRWQRQTHGVWEPVPNADLWRQTIAARSTIQVIEWVRGHNGTAGNERADQLALQGRLLNTTKETA